MFIFQIFIGDKMVGEENSTICKRLQLTRKNHFQNFGVQIKVWKSLDLDFLPFLIFLLRMRLSNITSQEKIPQNLFQNIPEEFSLFNIWHFIEFDHKQFKTFKKRRNLKSEAWHATPLGTLHILPNNTWNHYSYLKYVKMFFNSKHEN